MDVLINQLRWIGKRILRLLPYKREPPEPIPERPTILYLFSGTYGDMAQCLPALEILGGRFPQSPLYFWGPQKYLVDFREFLPENVKPLFPVKLLGFLLKPAPLLYTNAVGVYRTFFEGVAYRCARRSYGFRYGEETRRPAYLKSIPLHSAIKDFSRENTSLVRQTLTGVPAEESDPSTYAFYKGRGILFHMGSRGFKNDLGVEAYTRLIRWMLKGLKERGHRVLLVSGPGDEAVLQGLRKDLKDMDHKRPSLPELKGLLTSGEWNAVCLNSFMAHFCFWLQVPAAVVHYPRVPVGYDCSPLHRQYVLRDISQGALASFFRGLE